MAKTQIKPKEGDKDRAVIFYNDDDREDDFFVDSDQFVIPFGFKSKMFTHDFICDEEAWKQAKDVHELYLSRRQKDKVEEFGNLYLQEKQSNIYRSINTIFKLSTLGFRVDENPFNDARDLKADAIFKDIDDGKYASYSYEDYFKLTPRVAIAFQEHARWNMSYFLAGYQAMPLEQIDYKEGKPRHKSHEFKRHACLVSFYDLDKVFKYEADLLKEKTKKPVKVEDTECYKYDLLRISKPKEDGKERKDDDDVTRFILENKQKKLYVHRKSDPSPPKVEEEKKQSNKKAD